MKLFDSANQLKDQGLYREAIEIYSAVEHIDPERAFEAGIKKAYCYYCIGEHNHVSRCVSNLRTKDAANSWVTNLAALSAYAIGNIEAAAQEFESLITDTMPKMRQKGLVGKAICFMKMGNIDAGIELLSNALNLVADEAEKKNIVHNLGWSFYLRGDYQKAKEMYQKAFDLDAKHPFRDITSFHALAEVNIKLENFGDAKLYLDRAIDRITAIQSKELESDNKFIRGCLLKAQGNYLEAFVSFEEARHLSDPNNVHKLTEIGDEMEQLYALTSKDQKDLMAATIAFELYIINKEREPSKAAGFLSVYKEIERENQKGMVTI